MEVKKTPQTPRNPVFRGFGCFGGLGFWGFGVFVFCFGIVGFGVFKSVVFFGGFIVWGLGRTSRGKKNTRCSKCVAFLGDLYLWYCIKVLFIKVFEVFVFLYVFFCGFGVSLPLGDSYRLNRKRRNR